MATLTGLKCIIEPLNRVLLAWLWGGGACYSTLIIWSWTQVRSDCPFTHRCVDSGRISLNFGWHRWILRCCQLTCWLWMPPNDFTPYLSFSLSSCLSSERHAACATHSWISLLLNMDQQTKMSVKGYKGNCWRESTNTRAWILYTYTGWD